MTELGHHHHRKKQRPTTKPTETKVANAHPITEHPKFMAFMDKFVFVLAFAGPLMTLPQILDIWLSQDATGVSFITWFSYFCLNILWLIYGILHREYPIIVAYICWMVANGSIALGVILYA